MDKLSHIDGLSYQPIKIHNGKGPKRITVWNLIPMYHFYILKHIFLNHSEHTNKLGQKEGIEEHTIYFLSDLHMSKLGTEQHINSYHFDQIILE